MDWLSLNAVLSICLGVGLAAACGFRVFAPFLVVSGAALAGQLPPDSLLAGLGIPLDPTFAWLGTWPAFIMLAVATVLEIAAYYVPWVDNVLDAAATPVAVLAGVLITASTMTEVSPLLKWTLAIIAGGGAAGLTQTATTAVRAASTALTGGLANWIVNTIETIGAFIMAVLAMVLPVLLVAVVAISLLLAGIWFYRRRQRPVVPAV
ncbi:MAG TPA: DUF4126 domain-containing protein [bacterium]|nr:DUF4126 domain-containing protein [bacterium]